MPLNKLQNFIKNVDGRTLYVNPNDLDSTDSIENDGTSLTQPFKTIQRALLESARFSFVAGSNNDLVEKTTILLFPGEHVVDNRPGWGIRSDGGAAKAFPPSGSTSLDPLAKSVFSLELNSNFDLTQEDNILYKFNSINGGVVVPRGTSIVGLDLRKTKIRPKYVPNPTDDNIRKSAIFRVTGACYFWQFSIFDGDETGLVYTHPYFFTSGYQSTPVFSHHKLTCFEYADGVNEVGSFGLTDLDMYYSKLSNAYNSIRPIPNKSKYPASKTEFYKKESEWKIVGAFESDPIQIKKITSGDGLTATTIITVETIDEHNLDTGTPIKIRGVGVNDYNISTKVASVDDDNPRKFTYFLPFVRSNLDANPNTSSATVTVETDTVSGASPYIFNCSLRSVWGMNGMLADGSKASGFRSMVVAQFTAVSLQKDDRAFVKYDPVTRSYRGVSYTPVWGGELSAGSSRTATEEVYHLDPRAIYRQGWESSHIKISNDSFIQIVSVFAIGFNKHFDIESGGDASITNSNSNFGQISLNSDGFRSTAFDKDNNAFITSIIPPKDIDLTEENIEWLSIDVGITTRASSNAPTSTRLYLYGFNQKDSLPVSLTQGYRIGARVSDKLYLEIDNTEYSANIYMQDGVTSSYKVYDATVNSSILTLDRTHNLSDGEKIIINSESGDLPENVIAHTVYYVIESDPGLGSNQIKLASSLSNARNGKSVTIYGGSQLKVYSRVSDKRSGDAGSPIQFDETENNWFINVDSGNLIYSQIRSLGVGGLGETTDLTYVKRIVDDRSLDEKLYKVRVVIPKELEGSKDPQTGFVIQESSSTGVGNTVDFTRTFIDEDSYTYNKNPRFITTCTESSGTVTVFTDIPHNLNVGDIVVIKNVKDSLNTIAEYDRGYNGKFKVTALGDGSNQNKDIVFRYSTQDVNKVTHEVGSPSLNNINQRTIDLPRFERNDLQSNLYIYRNEVISSYIENSQDGIYHLYVLNASNAITNEFTNLEYSQSTVDLYPQLDRDNPQANPPAAKTFALRSPIGDVNTSDLKKSITRETVDKLITTFGAGLKVTSIPSSSSTSCTLRFDRDHGLGGVVSGNLNLSNSNYNPGSYYNVKLLSGSPSGTWKGATAKVQITTGKDINSITIISSGSGHSVGEVLYPDPFVVGNGSNGTYTVSAISNNIGDVVQITGIGTAPDGYYRINAINNTTDITLTKSSADPTPIIGQYAFIIGPSSLISSSSYNSATGITNFTTSTPHGLLVGNKFRVINSSNNNVGDYIVEEKIDVNNFTAITNQNISPSSGYILKHGLSANKDVSDIANTESFGTRQVSFYGNEYLRLTNFISNDVSAKTVQFSWITSGLGTDVRFPLGSYIQIDDEIMRITSSGNSTSFQVIRGALGTVKQTHEIGSLIKRVNPIPVEFRRPSILRASGHTFEYLGYGPGNYSTGLPQVQIKSLSEREDFLAQSQERSCGAVIYTGMNSNGDFFSGNTKTSSVSGEVTSYDIPNPTVTGQDPSKSSVVFDEVTVKERLLVEGGDSNTVLSQFDGPVTFNQQVRFKNTSTFSGSVRITNTTGSDSITKGALTVKGGVGIAENLNLGGNLSVTGSSSITGNLSVTGSSSITGNLSVVGVTTANRFISTVSTGTAPLSVVSTTKVTNLNADLLDGLDTSSTDTTGSSVVVRNSGNFSAGIITATLSGNASSATVLQNSKTLWGQSFNGSANVSGSLSGVTSLTASGDISLGGELNFTTASNKFIDFYTTDGVTNYSAYLRLVDDASTDFHIAIGMERGGSVGLYYNNSNKLYTTNTGVTINGNLLVGTVGTGIVTAATFSGNATSATSAGSATYAATAGNGLRLWGVIASDGSVSNGGSGGWSSSRGDTGKYTIAFSPALPGANYCIVASALDSGSDEFATIKQQQTTFAQIYCRDDSGTLRNSPINFMIIY